MDLTLVIDPADKVGHKNKYINVMQHQILKDAMGDTKGKWVLDIGCGIRRFKDLFKQSNYLGIDNNPMMYPTDVAECDHIPYPSETFDIALSVWVMQYQPNLEECINEAMRVLKPGGLLVMIEQISETGYGTVLPRQVVDYMAAVGDKPVTYFPILRAGDLLVGAIRRGWVPERVFPSLARLHLMFWYLSRKGEYTDYLMVFKK